MTELNVPAPPHNAQGGLPHWFLYAGGGVAIIALFLYMKNKGTATGGSTVAAGTSINAALGSLQEQAIQTQGDLTKANFGISNLEAHLTSEDATATARDANSQAGQAWLGANEGAILSTLQTNTDYLANTINSSTTTINANTDNAVTSDQSTQHLTSAATGTH